MSTIAPLLTGDLIRTVLTVGVVAAALATAVALRLRRYLLAVPLAAAAVALARQLLSPAVLAATAVAVVIGGAALLWYRVNRSAATVSRWGARHRRKEGVASTLDIARIASAAAMRRQAPVVRPSLAELTVWRRLALPTTAAAVPLARVGLLRVFTSVEDVTLTFGGPRTGKSVWLAGRILDAPGAALVTSTRLDLFDVTRSLRATDGRPVYVFNAAGLGGLDSTCCFDPLTGCTDPVTAAHRSADMIGAGSSGGGDSERAWWDGQARRVLAAMMHAAAIGGLGMRDVQRWVSDPVDNTRQITSLLRRSAEPTFVDAAAQFLNMAKDNPRTTTSITSSITPALEWLTSPAAAAAASGATQLDVAELLRRRGTIYLLGGREFHTAPLTAALTGHIAREARRLAARSPGGRLDPPLTLNLDEVALVAPMPLEDWTADMGGRGVTIIAAFQSRAQLLSHWGAHAAGVILTNAAAIMVFGGTHDRDDLEHWSSLAGDRDEPVVTTDSAGNVTSRSVRKVPVVSPAQLANLPKWRVLLIRRHLDPVIGRVRPTWRRRDMRRDAATRRALAAQREREQAVIDAAEAATRPADAPPTGRTHPDGTRPGAGDSPAVVARWVESHRTDREDGTDDGR